MAMQKAVRNVRTGHVNEVLRVDAVAISRRDRRITIVGGLYSSQEATVDRQPDDRRDWELGPSAFPAVALRSLADDLRYAGHPVDSWPAEVVAVLEQETTYANLARGCYRVIAETRRPLPIGSIVREDGSTLLPTGEVVAAEALEGMPDAPTIPSEFAGAAMV